MPKAAGPLEPAARGPQRRSHQHPARRKRGCPRRRGAGLLRIEPLAITSNNVTYAAMRDDLRWQFFPADESWGRIPVWGFDEGHCDTSVVSTSRRLFRLFPSRAACCGTCATDCETTTITRSGVTVVPLRRVRVAPQLVEVAVGGTGEVDDRR